MIGCADESCVTCWCVWQSLRVTHFVREEILLFSKLQQDSTSAAKAAEIKIAGIKLSERLEFFQAVTPHAVTCLKMCCTLETKLRVNEPKRLSTDFKLAILTTVVSVSTGPCRHIWTGGTRWEWNLWSSIQGKTLHPHATPDKLSKWPVIQSPGNYS